MAVYGMYDPPIINPLHSPQLSRFVYIIAFKCIFSQYDQKSVSMLFIVILLHSVVEYSLNQFPCHRHVFSVKTVNKQVSHAL